MSRKYLVTLPLLVGLAAVTALLGRWDSQGVRPAHAADCMPGPHSGTLPAAQDWCPEHNPHLVTSSVIVPEGITLTLRPGVIVQTADGHRIQVTGVLNAIGTPGEPITLTSAADSGPGQWGGIYLTSGEADLRHVTIRYTGQFNTWGYAAINVAYSRLRLVNSVVRDSVNVSLPDYGVHLCCSSGAASATISNTLFANIGNTTADFAVLTAAANNPITVTNSTFLNNAGYPIQTLASLAHQVSGNSFSDNGLDRILVKGGWAVDGARLTAQDGLEGYELDGQLRVPAGRSLSVEPGVTLMARSGTDVRVQGHLEAIGTAAQPITFTSALNSGPEQWGSVYMQEGSADLRYVTVRYGGQLVGGNLVGGALFLQSTGGTVKRVNLDHVTVRENACAPGTLELAVSANGSLVTMNASSVISNGNAADDYGIYVNAGVLTMTHSRVQDNAGIGLRVNGGRAGLTCDTVSGNGGDGIRVTGGSGTAVVGTGIYDNAGLGLNNTTVQVVPAAFNWWGDASGPGGAGPGSGDEVSANVEYAPWLTAEGCFTGLFIDKTAEDLNGQFLLPGDVVRYTIAVSNGGTLVQTNLAITDALPAGVTFVGATPAGYSGPDPLRWLVPSLAPGAVWTGTITVTVDREVAAIGGNVAQAVSEQQPRIQTAAILPPGGGAVGRALFLPLLLSSQGGR